MAQRRKERNVVNKSSSNINYYKQGSNNANNDDNNGNMNHGNDNSDENKEKEKISYLHSFVVYVVILQGCNSGHLSRFIAM